MQFLKSFYIALLAGVSVIRAQYTIDFYTSSDCGDDNFAVCSNIAAYVCCVTASDLIGSAQGSGLDSGSNGVPDIIVSFDPPFGCDSACNTAGGDNTECVDCGGEDMGGACIATFGTTKRDLNKPMPVVYTDQVGILDAALGIHRMFYVNSSVPADVTTALYAAVRNSQRVHDLSSAALKYEVL